MASETEPAPKLSGAGSGPVAGRWRVKPWILDEDRQWIDAGTGLASCVKTAEEGTRIVIESESNDHKILLDIKLDPAGGHHFRRADTIITWEQQDNETALSFQEPAGCHAIWEAVCEAYGIDPSATSTGSAVPATELSEDSDDSSDDSSSSEDEALFSSAMARVTSPAEGSSESPDRDAPGTVADLFGDIEEAVLPRQSTLPEAAGAKRPAMLPPAELDQLFAIRDALNAILMTHMKRQDLILYLSDESSSYIPSLFRDVYKQLLEHGTQDQRAAFGAIAEALLRTHDATVVEVLGSAAAFPGFVAAMTWAKDPSCTAPQDPAASAVVKRVVAFSDPTLVDRIHLHYRLAYMRDMLVSGYLDSGTLSAFTSSIFFHLSDILSKVVSDKKLLTDLLATLRTGSVSVPTEHPLGAAAGRSLALDFLHELLTLIMSLSGPSRMASLKPLMERSQALYSSLQPILCDPAAPTQDVRRVFDIILLISSADPQQALRDYLSREKNHAPPTFRGRGAKPQISLTAASSAASAAEPAVEDVQRARRSRGEHGTLVAPPDQFSTLLHAVVWRAVDCPDSLVQLAACDFLRSILDIDPNDNSHERNRLCDDIFDRYFPWLLAPFLHADVEVLQEHVPSAAMSYLTQQMRGVPSDKQLPSATMRRAAQLLASGFDGSVGNESHGSRSSKAAILDLLCYLSQMHQQRIKRILGRYSFAALLRTLRYRDKPLVLLGLRFLRAILAMKDTFLHREVITHNLLSPVFAAALVNLPRDNLITTAVLEMRDFITSNEPRFLATHLLIKFAPLLKALTAFPGFGRLLDTPAGLPESAAPPAAKHRTDDDDDEHYFDEIEDDAEVGDDNAGAVPARGAGLVPPAAASAAAASSTGLALAARHIAAARQQAAADTQRSSSVASSASSSRAADDDDDFAFDDEDTGKDGRAGSGSGSGSEGADPFTAFLPSARSAAAEGDADLPLASSHAKAAVPKPKLWFSSGSRLASLVARPTAAEPRPAAAKLVDYDDDSGLEPLSSTPPGVKRPREEETAAPAPSSAAQAEKEPAHAADASETDESPASKRSRLDSVEGES